MAQSKQVLETAAKISNNTYQEWARIPRTGEKLEGLYRSQIFALVKENKIKSAAIKAPGASRAGMRLIHIPSLRAWIESHVSNEMQVAK